MSNKDPKSTALSERGKGPLVFPGMIPVGERFAQRLRDVIAGSGCNDAIVTSGTGEIKAFADWRRVQDPFTALCRYLLKPLKGAVLLSIPPAFITQLVDMFYGGTGATRQGRTTFTAAEHLFLERIADQCLSVFAHAWAGCVDIGEAQVAIETDSTKAVLVKDSDPVLVQTFTISGGALTQAYFHCVYPVASLRGIASLSQDPRPQDEEAIDPLWREAIRHAVLQAYLPMRSIFARPDIPVHQLLTLKPGDVIPITLPKHLPVTIAGRLFAHGSVGESSGRAAIQIEKIEQGNTVHD